MNKKKNKEKENKNRKKLRLKKGKNFKFCMVFFILFFIILLSGESYFYLNAHIRPSFSLRSDVTGFHNLYLETRNLKDLSELEEYLQQMHIAYEIKNEKLYTNLFNYDVSKKDNVELIIGSEIVNSFFYIDDRKLDSLNVKVSYKDGQKVEKLKSGYIEKIDSKYYQDFHRLFYGILFDDILFVIFSIFIIIFLGTEKVE